MYKSIHENLYNSFDRLLWKSFTKPLFYVFCTQPCSIQFISLDTYKQLTPLTTPHFSSSNINLSDLICPIFRLPPTLATIIIHCEPLWRTKRKFSNHQKVWQTLFGRPFQVARSIAPPETPPGHSSSVRRRGNLRGHGYRCCSSPESRRWNSIP